MENMNNRILLFEKYLLLNTLKKHDWNKTRTAEEIGISRQALDVKIKKFELEKNAQIPDPREFLFEQEKESEKLVSCSFTIPESDLTFIKLLARKLNRGSPRRVSLSEIIRLAIKHLKEKDPEEIQSDLHD